MNFKLLFDVYSTRTPDVQIIFELSHQSNEKVLNSKKLQFFPVL